ncbi:1-hydroxycarotenoid 3,4-desaturase CrtD [Alteriqipengyuania lutimaris]|uniref:Phytoene desaturase n=1 Tax=Alteriqipengyuania lutimaris TaxID=1538146 RepID=A0A395LJR9_9SPHN|nr:1-hydroxycarotenoid 3,4-desaturase CrtD [Alteriqipengyuania lutimaris]MBB3033801.1 1-hydroxycarotenoid 3,4-desaturase [Alteriqipengyuania lutimaris]RDS77223.1 phytoene desaturase [Alteriqipengyuania lutimaris]
MSGAAVVIGAGIGGLVSAALLAARGHDVTVIEKEASVGGKARQLCVDGQRIDAGPTVFTMHDVFEEIFASCGGDLRSALAIRPAPVIARHAWSKSERLDLFADPMRSEEAIGDFAGAEAARGYRSFRTEARRIYNILDESLLRQEKVYWPLPLMQRIGLTRFGDLAAIRPYESLWKVLGAHFRDERLRQLFGRYSTYCGSSPFDSPATLMLIAHVEAKGVWLIEGGMSALAEALKTLAEKNGARFRLGEGVARIEAGPRGATGVILDHGERIAADAVLCNADPAALASGRFGEEARSAVGRTPRSRRSLSALVWLGHAKTQGFALSRHNVFFSPDYRAEFAQLRRGEQVADPSVYLCAQDRDPLADDAAPAPAPESAPAGRERFQIIVNAPANGDTHEFTQKELDQCTQAMTRSLARCGLELEPQFPHRLVTPADFEALFPSTGGALYGRASHGWAASFLRQGASTRIPGLYCVGGSTHPGAGVPMAALSGRTGARAAMERLASMRTFRPAATAGGMSTRSVETGATA